MRRLVLLLFLLPALVPFATAQPTNMEAFQSLAIRCMDFLADQQDDLEIDAPAKMPFVRSAIVTWLNDNGREVFLADSLYNNKPEDLNSLRYQIDETSITYDRRKKKRALRTINFGASATLVSPEGRIIEDQTCLESFDDVIDIADISSLESNSYSETKGQPPRAGFGKRILQPLMLTAATTLTVYLFFTLRSDSGQ